MNEWREGGMNVMIWICQDGDGGTHMTHARTRNMSMKVWDMNYPPGVGEGLLVCVFNGLFCTFRNIEL